MPKKQFVIQNKRYFKHVIQRNHIYSPHNRVTLSVLLHKKCRYPRVLHQQIYLRPFANGSFHLFLNYPSPCTGLQDVHLRPVARSMVSANPNLEMRAWLVELS